MKSMTSRERIIAAIRREPVDRIPISPRLLPETFGYASSGVAATIDLKRNRYFHDPHIPMGTPADLTLFRSAFPAIKYINDVRWHVDVRDEGNTWRVTSAFETPAGPLRQVKIQPKPGRSEFGLTPNPHIEEYLVKNKTDLDRIQYLIPPSSSFSLGTYFEQEKAYWDEAVLMPSIHGPMDNTGGNVCEMTNLMVAYYEDRAFFDQVFEIFEALSISQLEWALNCGIRHFFLVWFYTSLSTGWSPTIYREVFAPIIKRQVDLIHQAGGIACFYDDGKLKESLPIIVETGVDCIETCTPAPMGDFDMAEAKRLYGKRVAFKGGMDIVNVIQRGTPELIDRKVRELVENGAPGSGLLIGTCDSIRPETPPANVAAYFKAANKYAVELAHLSRKRV